MTMPGVNSVVASVVAAAIGDIARFHSLKKPSTSVRLL
ncbi:transposase [Bradyrhizobium sp. DOA9]